MSTDQRPSTSSPSRNASPGHPRRNLRALGNGQAGARPLGSAPLQADWPDDSADSRADGVIAGLLANQVVALLRQHAGRGPTKSKCTVTADLVVVTLGDCLTTLETRLAAGGNIELVRRVRRELLAGLRPDATAIVEGLTRRQVVAYLTAQQDDPDLAVLIFYLDRPQPTAS